MRNILLILATLVALITIGCKTKPMDPTEKEKADQIGRFASLDPNPPKSTPPKETPFDFDAKAELGTEGRNRSSLYEGPAPRVDEHGASHYMPQRIPEPGDMTTVPKILWVMIKNPHGISNSNVDFGFEDQCVVDPGHLLRVIATKNGEVLVEHLTLSSEMPEGGTACPDRTLFFIDQQEFIGFASEYDALLREKEARRKEVEQLLHDAKITFP